MASFFDLLRANGSHVSCGAMKGLPNPDFAARLLTDFHLSLSAITFSLNSIGNVEVGDVAAKIFALANAGQLRAVIDEVLPLADAAKAHEKLETGSSFGKIVLRP